MDNDTCLELNAAYVQQSQTYITKEILLNIIIKRGDQRFLS